MWVKICANTNLEDALLAAELGADAVGFVFAPSPRQVTPAQVAAITSHLPNTVETVGVFPAWDADRIATAAQIAGLSTIQLHGNFDAELVHELRARLGTRIEIIQVLHWAVSRGQTSAETVLSQADELTRNPAIDRILVDSQVGSASGGTGVAFDWSAAYPLFAAHPGTVLAGGLNPENVREAIKQLNPWGIDVASGVEFRPGKKDRHKLQRFLAEARQTEREPQS